MNVFDRPLELILGLVRGVVRELRLVGADQVGRGVDDRLVELEDRGRAAGDGRRKTLELGIESHADKGVVAVPRAFELLDEGAHAMVLAAFAGCAGSKARA